MTLTEFFFNDPTYFSGGIHNTETLNSEINRWFDYMKRRLITKKEFDKWLEIRLAIIKEKLK